MNERVFKRECERDCVCDGDGRNRGNGDRSATLVMVVTCDGDSRRRVCDGRVTEKPRPLIK